MRSITGFSTLLLCTLVLAGCATDGQSGPKIWDTSESNPPRTIWRNDSGKAATPPTTIWRRSDGSEVIGQGNKGN